MKTINVIFIALIIASFATNGKGQLTANPMLSLHAIGNFDFTYDAYGLDLNGELGKNWSIGLNADYGKYEDTRFLSFNPNVKVYSKSAFEGLYLGAGLRYFKAKQLNDISMPFPLPESGSRTTFLGPEIKLGIAALIEDSFTMGFELQAGNAFTLDEPFFGTHFTFGIYIY